MKIDIADIAEMDYKHMLMKYGDIDKEDALLELHNICQAIKKDTNVDMERIKKLVRNKYDKDCLAAIATQFNRIFIISIDGKEEVLSCVSGKVEIKATLNIDKTILTLGGLYMFGGETEHTLEINVIRENSNTLINNLHSLMWLNETDPLIVNLKTNFGFGSIRVLTVSTETLDQTTEKELARIPILNMKIIKGEEHEDGERSENEDGW